MDWRTIGISRLSTVGTGMGGLAGLLPFQSNTGKKAFVAEHTPQFPSNLRVVAPVSPLPTGIFAPCGGFHRLERLSRNQFTPGGCGEQKQDIGRQMGEVVVSGLVFSPATVDFPARHRQFSDGRLP